MKLRFNITSALKTSVFAQPVKPTDIISANATVTFFIKLTF